jgi:hypothetical protein
MVALSTMALVLGAISAGNATPATAAAALPPTDPDWVAPYHNPLGRVYLFSVDLNRSPNIVAPLNQINRTGCMTLQGDLNGIHLTRARDNQVVWRQSFIKDRDIFTSTWNQGNVYFNSVAGIVLESTWRTFISGKMDVWLDSNSPYNASEFGNDLKLQGDGNLVIYDGHGRALWASNTFC